MIKTAVLSTAVVSGFRNRSVDDKNRGFKYSGC